MHHIHPSAHKPLQNACSPYAHIHRYTMRFAGSTKVLATCMLADLGSASWPSLLTNACSTSTGRHTLLNQADGYHFMQARTECLPVFLPKYRPKYSTSPGRHSWFHRADGSHLTRHIQDTQQCLQHNHRHVVVVPEWRHTRGIWSR